MHVDPAHNFDSMQAQLGLLIDTQRPDQQWQQPELFDLSMPDDLVGVEELLERGAISSAVDNVAHIASDLYKLHYPADKDDEVKKAAFVQGIIDQGIAFGTWVFFPWSGKLVRYPDKEDHRALRTWRNKNLVIETEQATLYDSTVLVGGLSIGSHVVKRLVSAGVGGKLIIGDMDIIEPSNLNRMDSSFLAVGATKVAELGQWISEIDPYIEQVHLPKGVSADNLDAVGSLHKPDIIVDEIDDLGMKAVLRSYAQQHELPLIMATDVGDKSVIDIERYDLGTGKPFVGKVNGADFEKLLRGVITPQERGQFLLRIVGLTNVTPRLVESAMQVENGQLGGLPQLGNTAAVGGAFAAIAAREILLGRTLNSGRYTVSPKRIMNLRAPVGLQKGIRTMIDFAKQSRKK